MLPTAKLTKRQKKFIAFRERKHGKRKDNPLSDLEVKIDVPGFEDQTLVNATQGQQDCQVGAKALVGKGKAGTKGEETKAGRVVVAARKGKRKVDEEKEGTLGESDQPEPKRRRGSNGSPLIGMEESVGDRIGAGEESEKTKQRFILFLGMHLSSIHDHVVPHLPSGNLKYTTTPEVIQTHFSECGAC